MSTNQCPASGQSIADRLRQNIINDPRTVEGDQGRWTGHSGQDMIAVDRYARNLEMAAKGRRGVRAVLRSMQHRLITHDGPGS